MSVPAAAAGFRARYVPDADAWHAANRRTDRRDAVLHRVGRSVQTRDVPTAAAHSRGETLMLGRPDGRTARRPSATWVAAVLSAVLSVPCLAQTDRPADRPSDRQIIDTIIIENRNIFDRDD